MAAAAIPPLKICANERRAPLQLPFFLVMAIEIERKFLVQTQIWDLLPKPEGRQYRQGYISATPEKSVRIRSDGRQAFLTIKGAAAGASRPEYEYEIPNADALEMLALLCDHVIVKTRFEISYEGFLWEVDVFAGDNAGLIVAEVELEQEDAVVPLPPWVGKEVTGMPQYYNARLAVYPYQKWPLKDNEQ